MKLTFDFKLNFWEIEYLRQLNIKNWEYNSYKKLIWQIMSFSISTFYLQ